MDTPLEDIEWMLHMERTETAARAPKRAAPLAPAAPPTPRIG